MSSRPVNRWQQKGNNKENNLESLVLSLPIILGGCSSLFHKLNNIIPE